MVTMNKKIYLIVIFLVFSLVGAAVYLLFFMDPVDTVNNFIEAEQNQNYKRMYSLLTEESKEKISYKDIKNKYNDFYNKFNLSEQNVKSLIVQKDKVFSGHAEYKKEYISNDFGKKIYEFNMKVKREGLINWRIVWDYNLIFPSLEKNSEFSRERILSERGEIFDRYGNPLVVKGEVVTVGIQPSRIENKEKLSEKLNNILNVNKKEILNNINKYPNHPDWLVPIKTLTMDKYKKLEHELRPIPGVVFRKKEARVYSQGEAAAHITGYIGEVSQNWIKTHQNYDYRSGDIVGRSGLERAFETKLRSKVGYKLYLENNDGDKNLLMKKEPQRGEDIYTTIDIALQKKAWQELSGHNGAVIILDPQSDEILAITSSPSFDPNLFSIGISADEWNKIRVNKDNPMLNRATQGLYPPGSIFKIITASAALDTGVFNVDSEFNDNGEYKVKGNIIKNYQNEVFNKHNFSDALINSINTTFAKIALKLGKDDIINYAHKFTIEEKLDFPLSLKVSNLGEIKSEVDLAWTALGQGEVSVTPFQVARIINTIARNGKLSNPEIIREKIEQSQTIDSNGNYIINGKEVIKEETALKLKKILHNVVEEGTAQNAKLNDEKVGGKTGTAEIDDKSDDTHAWFAAFTPIKNSELAMVVFLERGGVGGKDAAPIFKKIMNKN